MKGQAALLPPGVRVLERGWLSSNNVLIVGQASAALVDSGYATHSDQTLGLIRETLRHRPLDVLVNTHLHSDHCGGNAALQGAFPSLRTWIPVGQAEAVRQWDAWALTYEPTGQQCPRFSFTDILLPGSELQLGDLRWQVHGAPGHDPHSLILYEPASRTLLAADALWENGFGVVFQELEGERAFDAVAATLDLIERLQPSVVAPGHGGVFVDVREALVRARKRLDAYVSNPARHAAHGAKVLLKFKLLEVQRISVPALLAWALATPYFGLVRSRWFPLADPRDWMGELLTELERSRAVARDGEFVVNL